MTAIYPRSSTTFPYTAVIKAEGGATCKTFTFKDLGISASNGFQKFDALDIVLKDINGDQIGSTISLGSSPVYSTTSVTNISTLYSKAPWLIDDVAAIEITYALSESGISAFASDLNLENITLANVKGAPAITALSVLNGQTIGGDTVVITGSNFSGASAVNFGSTSAAGFTIDSPTRITATSPAVSTDMTVDITVATPLGISDASAADQFTYHKTNQSIFFGPAPTLIVGGTGTVAATATSGLTPSFNSATPGVCMVIGTAVTGGAVGTCSITADQPGNSFYNSAQQVTLNFSVGKGNQTISFGTAPAVIVGGTGTVSATATSGLTPGFDTTTPAVCTISGTTVTGVTAGTCVIAATQSGNTAYNTAAQVTQSFSVGKADQVISFGTAPAVIVGGTGTVSATATSGLTPSFDTTTPAVCTVSGTTVTGVSAGTCAIAANQSGDNNYKAALQVTQSFSVGKTNQTISFGAAPAVIFGGTATVSATVNSGLAPIFSSTTPAVCTISGITVTGVTAGTCIIAADQGGNSNYNAAPQVTQSFNVGKSAQTISFGPAPTLIVGGTGTVSATATSGLTPIFSSTTPVVCTISGATVTGVTAGTCIIAANQAGDVNYYAAPQVTQNFSKANQIISFGAVPTVYVGGTGTVSATATSGLIPSISSLTPAVCSISGTTVTGVSAGTCIVAANQLGNNTYNSAPQVSQSFSIGKADQTISFGPAPAVIFGGAVTVSATTTSGLAPTFSTMTPAVCTISGVTVTGVTAGTCIIAADQGGNSNYNAALQVTQNINVGKANQTISFGTAPAVIFGGTGTVSATASSGLTPLFSSMTPAVCTISGTTVTGVAVGTCTIAADQPGASSYSAAPQVSQSFGVGRADQTISFGPAPTLIVGGNGTVSATTTSGLVPTFSTMTPAVCTITGTTVTGITAGSCIIAADQSGNINYNAAPQVTQNFSKANQIIYFGPAPTVIVGATGTVSATATSGLPPTFRSLTPVVCTASGTSITGVTVGTCIIAANQGGDGAYNAASQVTQSFGVGKGNQIISFGAAPTIIAGGTGVVSASAASGLSPTFSSLTPDVCTVSGTSVTGVTAGTCIIAAKQIGNSIYDAAPQVTQTFSVGKGGQTISFGSIPFVIVGGTGSVSATSTSGLTPIFSSSTPLVCRVSGTTVTGISSGTCSIAAEQYGDATYNPASRVLQSFSVGKGNQTISFGTIPVIVVGGTGTVSATATSGLTPAFTSMTPAVCTVTGSTVTGVTAGTCTIAANQSGDSNYNAALEAIQSISVVFSITLPQITLSTLDDGAFSSVDTINIAGAVTALNGLRKLTINDADITVTSSGTFSSLLTLVPGINSITVVATDNNDLTSTVIRTITLDATAPLITLAGGQTDNSITSSSQITVSGSVDSDTTTVKISINGGTPEPAVMAGTGFSLPVTLSSGLNTILITAIDAAGKSSSSKQSIVFNEAISLAVTAPTQDLKSGKREFTLTGLVSGAEPLTVIVEMDGQSFTQAVSSGSFSQPLTFTAEKNYPIHVTANDGNGSSVTITRNVTYIWTDVASGGGIMSLSDVLNAFHIALGLKQPTATDLIRCDVAPLDINGKPKGNNRIDIGDVILMLRNLVELVTWQ
ncbi:MAG: IPT/TIG domain-containing protein [Desulfuromonadaceae bacterium]